MKKLMVVLFSLLFAASAFAAELSVAGDYSVRGRTVTGNNHTAGADFGWYDQDLNLWLNVKVDEKTTVKTRLAIMDTEFGKVTKDEDDDKIAVERAWGIFKINDALTIEGGRMTGGAWGMIGADNTGGYSRVKAVYKVKGLGPVIVYTQKNDYNAAKPTSGAGELGLDNGTETAEKKELDILAIGTKLKFGAIKVEPLYVMMTKDTPSYSSNKIDLYVGGTFGGVTVDAEYISQTGDAEGVLMGVQLAYAMDNMDFSVLYLSADDGGAVKIGDDLEYQIYTDLENDADTTVTAVNFGYTMGKAKIAVDYAMFDFGAKAKSLVDQKVNELNLTYSYSITEATAAKFFYAMASGDPSEDITLMGWQLTTSF